MPKNVDIHEYPDAAEISAALADATHAKLCAALYLSNRYNSRQETTVRRALYNSMFISARRLMKAQVARAKKHQGSLWVPSQLFPNLKQTAEEDLKKIQDHADKAVAHRVTPESMMVSIETEFENWTIGTKATEQRELVELVKSFSTELESLLLREMPKAMKCRADSR